MTNIIYKYTQKNEAFISPQFPPNNLKTIKKIFNLTDKELADMLDLESSFVSSVINNRATFSGSITLKLLKELNISFSTLYNIDSTISIPCEDFEDIIIVVAKEEGLLANDNSKYDFIAEALKDYDIPATETKVCYANMDIIDNKLSLNFDHLSRIPSNDKIDLYKSKLDEISKLTAENGTCYYFIGAEHKRYVEKEITIDTLNSLDVETTNLLNEVPFKKLINVIIPKEDYEVKGTKVILKNPYTILRNSKLKSTDTLNKKDYSFINNDSITFTAFSSKDSRNKFKYYRMLKGYSMDYMANLFNVSTESYRLIEIGHNKLTTHQMWKIENCLGILLENIIDIDAYYNKFND